MLPSAGTGAPAATRSCVHTSAATRATAVESATTASTMEAATTSAAVSTVLREGGLRRKSQGKRCYYD